MKKTIKNLTAVMVFGAAVIGSQSVRAQVSSFVPDDLYMGFQNQSGAGKADYIINLGPAGNIVGGSTIVNLSGDFSFSSFTSTGAGGLEGTNAADILGGVIGGSSSEMYATQLRFGGAGSPSTPGSSQPAGQTKGEDNEAFDAYKGIVAPAAGAGTLDTTLTWENDVEPTFTAGSEWGITGVNPDSSITTNSVLYEDLWYTKGPASGVGSYTYEGYFTLTVGTSSATLTFTPKNASVPLTSPQIEYIQVTGNAATLVWTTVASHTYQLQYDLDLNTSNWVNVGSSQVASYSTMTNTDNSATQSLKFYRVTGQ